MGEQIPWGCSSWAREDSEMKEYVLTVRLRDRYKELDIREPISLEYLTETLQELIDDGIGGDDPDDPNIIVKVTACIVEEMP